MDTTTVFVEEFGRMPELVRAVVDGLGEDDLAYRVDGDANPIAWLVWHLTRVQDDHLAGAAAALGWDRHTAQVWTEQGFADRFDLPFAADEIGYGQSPGQVAQVRASAGDLIAYHDAVHTRTTEFLRVVSEGEWDQVVDPQWDPPVTLTARLASVLADVTQHVGQAAYVRGLLERSAG